MRIREFGLAGLSALALALAFPKFNQAWLAPLGAAGLFFLWERLSWKRAFACGWFAGLVFFGITFSWITHALGADLGLLAPAIVLVVASILALYIGAAGALASLAYRRAHPALAPLAASSAFAVVEWLRSIGVLAVPFEALGYAQVSTPLAVFAPYVGVFGVTFAVCAIGAYIAHALATANNRALLAAVAVTVAAWTACWLAWPARHAPQPDMRVAAVQGNIPQSLKWGGVQALDHAMSRYDALTRKAASFHPQFVAWPETAATVQLNYDTQNGPRIAAELQRIARDAGTTLAVGSLDVHAGREFNAVYVFDTNGVLRQIYDKRQLVPFAEHFPGRSFLGWLPGSSLISDFGIGHDDAVLLSPKYSFAPVICWESAFSDLVHAQVARGAQALLIQTDDAWFGETSGPYQHAEIAQMRALETGRWVLRAAQTGISGIIAPDGRWTERSDLDVEALVLGSIGAPASTVYAAIGPTPVAIALALLYVALVARRRRA